MATASQSPTHSDWINRARNYASAGRLMEAEQAYTQALQQRPRDVECLNFVGMCAIRRGEAVTGTLLLKRASELEPGNAAVLCNLGLAYRAAGEWALARDCFQKAMSVAPQFHDARLYFGDALEQLGQRHEALANYFGAILAAQNAGQWMNESSTPAVVRPLVLHAMRYVKEGRRALFETALLPLRDRYGSEAMQRVDQCLAMYLLELPVRYSDPAQRPGFLYFPDLPAQPFFDVGQFSWVEEYESCTAAISQELAAILERKDGVEPVHAHLTEKQLEPLLRNQRAAAAWDAYYFYRHGASYDDNRRRCPQTATALDRLPLARIREHAPEAMFSLLTPGTHILPHRGVTNVRTVTHLPLVVPDNCVLKVSGEERGWRAGKCLAFDDTYEHEAWNESDSIRVVLIADIWNPHLSEAERAALSELIPAIGDFNRECGIE
jgi:aspartate beta-hydroxylase